MCIEVLRQKSARNQGLAFYDTSDEIPKSVYFAYQYVPTILATLFSTFWSMIDLDAKRMEPYSQITKPHAGEIPFKMLLLDYVYSFPLQVPYLAFKRCHWRVMFNSSVFLIITILLTPIQSALLGLQVVNLSRDVSISVWQDMSPFEDQSQLFTGEAINQARSYLIGNEELPPFATEDYAVSYMSFERLKGLNKSLKLKTRVYWSEPTCINVIDFQRPVLLAYQNIFNTLCSDSGPDDPVGSNYLSTSAVNVSVPWRITNEHCNLTLHVARTGPLYSGTTLTQLTWKKTEPWKGTSKEGLFVEDNHNCTDYPFWASYVTWNFSRYDNGGVRDSFDGIQRCGDFSDRNFGNVTAIAALCRPEYYSSLADITFSENGTILTIQLLDSDPFDHLYRSEIDVESFEKSLGNSRDETSNFPNALSAFVDINPFTMTDLINMTLRDISNIDWGKLDEAVKKNYRLASTLTFAHALRNWGSNSTSLPEIKQAEYRAEYTTIAINSFFAIMSEIILGFAILVTLINGSFYTVDRNILRHDPDSLASILSLIATYIRGANTLDRLSKSLERVSLEEYKQNTCSFTFSVDTEEHELVLRICSSKAMVTTNQVNVTTQSRFYITTPIFVLSMVVLSTAVAILATLLALSSKSNFTYLADSISLDAQALWQFTPTLIATGIGLGWLFIQRDLVVLEPWVRMSLGAPATSSLSLNYGSRIPEMIVFKALRNRQYLVAFVSSILILNSVLSIVMGGLFSQSQSEIDLPTEAFSVYRNSKLPTLETWSPYEWIFADVFEIVRTSLSVDTLNSSQQSSSIYYFLPIQDGTIFDTIPRDSTAFYSASTLAVSASLECALLGEASNRTFWDALTYNSSQTLSGLHYPVTGYGTPFPELNMPEIANSDQRDIPKCFFVFDSEGQVSPLPEHGTLFAKLFDFNGESSRCDEYMLIMDYVPVAEDMQRWEESLDDSIPIYISHKIEGALCWPKISVENVTISLDTQGRVQKYVLHGPLKEQETIFEDLERHIRAFTFEFLSDKGRLWQNTSYSRGAELHATERYDWPGLLTARAKSLHPDPSNTQGALANAASEVFARTFVAFWELYHDQFLNVEPSGKPTPAILTQTIARMQPSIPAFVITLLILNLYVAAAVLVYIKRRKLVTPRMPNSIGSILPWVIHSRILKDFEGTIDLSSSRRNEFLNSLGKNYMFGWFKDEEGILRLGLEDSRYVERPWQPDS